MARRWLPDIHVHGWRSLTLVAPRVWRWGTCWRFRLFPGWAGFDVGARVYKDEDGEMVGALALAPLLMINVEFVRMFTRREQRRRREEVTDLLADEAHAYIALSGSEGGE